MKIGIGADTQDFDKGARKVQQEMKDLNKVSSDALSSIGAALGIDTGKVQQLASAMSGLANKFTRAGADGVSAFSQVSGAIATVGAGIAALGLAAAIASFKELKEAAAAFESTIQGGVIKAQTDAYKSTFIQSIRDQTGAGERWSKYWNEISQSFTRLGGIFKSGFNSNILDNAEQAGGRAKEIATELYNIELQRKENSVRVSQIDAQIARQREIIYDTTKSATERSEALARAQQLIKEKLDLQLPLAKRERDLLVEYNSLASTTNKEYDAEISAKIAVNGLIQQEAAEQRTLLRQQKQINEQLEKEAMLKNKEDLAPFAISRLPGITGKAEMQVEVPIVLKAPQNTEEIKQEFLDLGEELSSIFEDFTNKMAESIGELTANLINGERPWQNFANSAISAFGDMAISVGKLAISTGYATLGIQTALESLNGWVAIAAGVALVALGSAVKAGMANIAAGNYSSGAGVAVATTSSSIGNDYESRDVYVNVQGTLRADGDQLVAVIQNTNRKNTVTT